MRIITEIELRDTYKTQAFETFEIPKEARLSPAALGFLNERKIKTFDQSGGVSVSSQHRRLVSDMNAQVVKGNSIKPEECTNLNSKELVLKNHSRIIFRGKIDSLQANLILVILEIKLSGYENVAEELTKILEFLRKILRAEVMDESLSFIDFNGWSSDEIRDRSHHPNKYYGIKHFTPDPSFGMEVARLNQIRTMVRELELSAITAFVDEKTGKLSRKDIIMSINRLSSLVYIIMCQFVGGLYK